MGATPRQRLAAACAVSGRGAVVSACLDLLDGRPADPDLVLALGGPAARVLLTGGSRIPDHWLRVWAARGLLWVWDDRALPALLRSLTDEQWRVREMAAKVAARHAVDEAVPQLLDLRSDPWARVRNAAERAVVRATGGERATAHVRGLRPQGEVEGRGAGQSRIR